MASPQKENGFTPIANEILEILAKTPLNGTQRRILDVIFRFTFGFNRKEHQLSTSYISKATNINKRQIQKELNYLIQCKIIKVVDEATFISSRILAFNKNYDSWQVGSWQVTKKTSGDKLVTSPGDKLIITPEEEKNSPNVSNDSSINAGDEETIKKTSGDKLVTQKRNNKKNIKTKTYAEGSIEMSLTLELIYLMKQNNQNVRIPKDLNKWAAEIDKMIRLDSRTPEDIRRVIYFSQKDPFWQCNILSTKKLREKFDTLYLKCKNSSFIPLNDDEMDSFRIVLSEIREGESDG